MRFTDFSQGCQDLLTERVLSDSTKSGPRVAICLASCPYGVFDGDYGAVEQTALPVMPAFVHLVGGVSTYKCTWKAVCQLCIIPSNESCSFTRLVKKKSIRHDQKWPKNQLIHNITLTNMSTYSQSRDAQ